MERSDIYQERRLKQVDRRDEYRTPFQRDAGRVIHSFGFRRLQGKTQVLGPEQGDFQRNRLTHSLEVASISKSISQFLVCQLVKGKLVEEIYPGLKELLLPRDEYDHLISTISLLHDIGHTPFGHAGEIALNFKMHHQGGFEGNAQTLRLLTKIEGYVENNGLNLTRRTLLGILKYPAKYSSVKGDYPNPPDKNKEITHQEWIPPKCYYDTEDDVVKWILDGIANGQAEEFQKVLPSMVNAEEKARKKPKHQQTIYQSFDCSIMDYADEIAYAVHDVEDAVHFKMINESDIADIKLFAENIDSNWKSKLFSHDKSVRKSVLANMIHELILNIEVNTNNPFQDSILKYNVKPNVAAKSAVSSLKKVVTDKVIESQENAAIVYINILVVAQLFDAIISSEKDLLPKQYQYENDTLPRRVSDYIAGMTDEYARKLHRRLYGGDPRFIFQRDDEVKI